jgi:predicted O-methyltransferase YrrM
MDQQQWDAMDAYLCQQTQAHDEVLEAALAASNASGLPPINVAPNQGKLLNLLARLRGARHILEIGTLGGYSTIWLARALPPDGTLLSLEANPDYAEVARKNLERAGLASVATVVVGAAAASLEGFVRKGMRPFDFIFIDADKKSYPEYLRLALSLSKPARRSLATTSSVVAVSPMLTAPSPM